MTKKIKIGTRGSKLALWQAYHIEELLQKNGLESEIIPIDTKGDKILDVSIAKIGSKGVFTEEIEDQLKSGSIDIAVHSAKDMQSELPEGFEIIAFTEREKENDVFLSHKKGIDLKENKSIVIGTSSTRRVAMLQHYYPHFQIVEMRGNLQTRISKMESGVCDILMLAYAGVFRMNYGDMIVKELPTDVFTPAVGQGSIAIECAKSLDTAKKQIVRESINHEPTESRLLAERAFLKKLQGGCSIPVFALSTIENDILSISGGIFSLDGKFVIRKSLSGKVEDAPALGEKLGTLILDEGGKELLAQIRKQIQLKSFYI